MPHWTQAPHKGSGQGRAPSAGSFLPLVASGFLSWGPDGCRLHLPRVCVFSVQKDTVVGLGAHPSPDCADLNILIFHHSWKDPNSKYDHILRFGVCLPLGATFSHCELPCHPTRSHLVDSTSHRGLLWPQRQGQQRAEGLRHQGQRP